MANLDLFINYWNTLELTYYDDPCKLLDELKYSRLTHLQSDEYGEYHDEVITWLNKKIQTLQHEILHPYSS